MRIADGGVELSGPMLADGYLGDPARSAAAFATDADGTRWYRTGDLGELAHDGTLRIRGRADDVIISGGVKVSLGDVERAVRTVPGFGEAVAVRVPDLEWGERAAIVAVRTDAAAASDALATLAAATDAPGSRPPPAPCASHSWTDCRCSRRASPIAAHSRRGCAAIGPCSAERRDHPTGAGTEPSIAASASASASASRRASSRCACTIARPGRNRLARAAMPKPATATHTDACSAVSTCSRLQSSPTTEKNTVVEIATPAAAPSCWNVL